MIPSFLHMLFSGTLVGAIITGQLYMHEIKLCDMKPLKGGLRTPLEGGEHIILISCDWTLYSAIHM